MTTRNEWLSLAKRCQEAKGPDREIDVTIEGAAKGWSAADTTYACLNHQAHRAWVYTASLDAITSLIEKELQGARVSSWNSTDEFRAFACIELGGRNFTGTVPHGPSSEALSRCAAFCLAKAEMSND